MLATDKSEETSKSALLVCLEFKQEKLHGGTLRTSATHKTLIELGYEVEVIQLYWKLNESKIHPLRRMKRKLFPLPFKNYRVTSRIISEAISKKDFNLVVCNWQPMMSACIKLNLPIWLDFMDDWKSVSRNEANEKKSLSKLTTILQGNLWAARQKMYSNGSSTFLSCAGYTDSQNLAARFLPTPLDKKANNFKVVKNSQSERFRLGFIGNFMYSPNRLGVEKFLREFSLEKNEKISFTIAGYSAGELSNAYTHNFGEVDNVHDFYKEIDGVVCPIYKGGGIKVKAIEGMIYGFKVFATAHVMSGFPENIQILFNPLNDLNTLDREELLKRSKLTEQERAFIEEYFSIEYFRNQVRELIHVE